MAVVRMGPVRWVRRALGDCALTDAGSITRSTATMKAATLHSLLTARTLRDEAARLIESGDRHMCSAGLVMLQDALEIVFLAMLTEKAVDELKSLESKSFDELIGELRKAGIKVPKAGTLKALNKQRIITKHYGQLAEPVTVRGYAEAAEVALASIVPHVLGLSLRDIFLSELLDEGEARELLNEGAALIDKNQFLDALIAVRKALFVEIEHEYAIDKWADVKADAPIGLLGLTRGGLKAPSWTRNKAWIEANVKDPLDYVQIDHEQLRLDGMEWGVNTAELENLRRLTPSVFRPERGQPWHVQYDMDFPPNEATSENARYCLDRAISILLRKQHHTRIRRWPRREVPFDPPAIYLDAPVYERATQQSIVVHRIQSGYEYTIHQFVTGFNPSERFYHVAGSRDDPDAGGHAGWLFGYLLVQGDVAD